MQDLSGDHLTSYSADQMIKETLGSCRKLLIVSCIVCLAWPCNVAASSLTCHCLENASCNPANGFCSNGCERGWYGPGCQVGNVALNKPAVQSSTYKNLPDYPATAAVDGSFPSSGDSAAHCSHTGEVGLKPNAWWYVILSNTTQSYQITNITIVNRGVFGYRLSNFSILYANDSAGDPDPSNWSVCVSWADQTSFPVRTYSCATTAIAKKVAIYLGTTQDNILTLCEVYIYGFEYFDCTHNYTGPGCLLQSCSSLACRSSSSSCGQYGGCRFQSCPDNRFLPPGCWIMLPDFSNSHLTVSPTCNNINVSMEQPVQQGDLLATSYIFHLTRTDTGAKTVLKKSAAELSLSYHRTTISVAPASTYSIYVVPELCNSTAECSVSNADNCLPVASCNEGLSSAAVLVRTGIRKYGVQYTGSCITVTETSETKDCEAATGILVQCENNSQSINASGMIICGLNLGETYNCSVSAIISDGSVDWNVDRLPPISPTIVNTAAIVGGSVGSFLLIMVIGIVIYVVVICRRKKRAYKRSDSDVVGLHPVETQSNSAFANESLTPADCEPMYDNTAGMTIQQLALYVKDEGLIAKRFSEVVANKSHPCAVAKDPANKSKNRFQNIIPYDVNRVIITGNGSCSYINASFIDGFGEPKKYIATQGPSAATVNDFWFMVWEQQATIIVMLTNFVESGKKKCEEYFPKLATEDCPITVEMRSQSSFDTHTVSILDVHFRSETRTISHYQLLCWRDQSVPEHCAEMLLFYNKLFSLAKNRKTENYPIIVHCSAGVGRTGAFIAFDCLLQRYGAEKRVDVDSCVVALRDQRMQMVQTKEQYIFLHEVTLYGMKTLPYIINSSSLPSYAERLTQESQASTNLAEEWKVLQECTKCTKDCEFAVARLQENVGRNRDQHILAADSKRPLLAGVRGESQSAYINAVFCNGCYSDRQFIATQLPLLATVSDFWQMVYECRAGCLVLLHDMPPSKDCPEYWPSTGEAKAFGQYVVTCSGQGEVIDGGAYREMDISVQLSALSGDNNKTEVLPLKMFIVNEWSWESELPSDTNMFLELATSLTPFCKASPKRPVVVQCRDGATHCGLFISAINAMHRLTECNQVQVFHSVDLARASRQQFVKSQEQYKFIYEFLLEYFNTVAVYANA